MTCLAKKYALQVVIFYLKTHRKHKKFLVSIALYTITTNISNRQKLKEII